MSNLQFEVDGNDPVALAAVAAKCSARVAQLLNAAEEAEAAEPKETKAPAKDDAIEVNLDRLLEISGEAWKADKTKMMLALSKYDVKKVRDIPEDKFKEAFVVFYEQVHGTKPKVK